MTGLRAAVSIAALAVGLASPVSAYDGWHLQRAATIDGKPSAWDYVAFDEGTNRLFLGHRKEGLQVFDPATQKVVKVIDKTGEASSNGAVLIPEFDLGFPTTRTGPSSPSSCRRSRRSQPSRSATISTPAITIRPASGSWSIKAPARTGPTSSCSTPLAQGGRPAECREQKVEGADSDGKSAFFLAAQDLDKVYRIDAEAGKVLAEFDIAARLRPGRPPWRPMRRNDRVFVGCRGHDTVKPSLVVLEGTTGKIVYSAEIGGGTDSIALRRRSQAHLHGQWRSAPT